MMMKTLIPFLFLLAACVNCFAQNKEPKNEFGISLLGVEGDPDYFPEVKLYYFNGIQYKRVVANKYAIRLSGQYISTANNYTVEPSPNSSEPHGYTWNTTIKSYEVRLGAERVFLSGKFKPFVFGDIAYRQMSEKGSTSGYCYYCGNYTREINDNYYLAGTVLGFGAKYYPTQHLYFSIESGIGLYTEMFSGTNGSSLLTTLNPIKTIVFGARF